MILCTAIFGKDDSLLFCKNEVKKIQEQEVQMFLYCSYDIIGEKKKLALNKSTQDNFLGSLLSNNLYRSYGYLTNTNVKFLIVTEASDLNLKDQDIQAIFKKLHNNYCKAIACSFYHPFSLINSRFLNNVVAEIFKEK